MNIRPCQLITAVLVTVALGIGSANATSITPPVKLELIPAPGQHAMYGKYGQRMDERMARLETGVTPNTRTVFVSL